VGEILSGRDATGQRVGVGIAKGKENYYFHLNVIQPLQSVKQTQCFPNIYEA